MEPPGAVPSSLRSFSDVAASLASADHRPARIGTYLTPLRRLGRRCRDGSVSEVTTTVEALASAIRDGHLSVPPGAAAEAVLAADASRGTDCANLAAVIGREVDVPLPHAKSGWGGYAGTLAGWRSAHKANASAFSVSGPGRVFTLVERFRTPLTAQLTLASIEHSLLPGKVNVVYALKAAQCQQAIFMGPTLGKLFGNGSLGAFVELSSGKGVGHTPYDANRVDRARITPLGRIGGQPCT